MNRIVNFGIRVLFRHGYDDTTNAFKAYRRHVVENLQPLVSNHFNLTVEMPLEGDHPRPLLRGRPDQLDEPHRGDVEARP